MKNILLAIYLLCFGLNAHSQDSIKLVDVAKHIGDSVTVCGKVSGIRFLESATNQPTFINLGGTFPNQLLTIVIQNEVLKKFEKIPEELYMNKEVCVTGKIEMYRERPQIVLKTRSLIGHTTEIK